MEIFLIILISVLIGLFIIDILLGFVNSIFESKHQVEIERRLRTVETLLSCSADDCQAIGFDIGGENENVD